MASEPYSPDSWQHLKQFTAARIALGRAGSSLTTSQLLAFQQAHAQARDAVHTPLDAQKLADELSGFNLPVLPLHSRAADRATYLQRPDLGRRLDEASVHRLRALPAGEYDISLVVADGLSALAVQGHTGGLFAELIPALLADSYRLAPLCVVEQGRVAVGDEIGGLLHSRLVVIFIGERPGLSSPDSLGIYLTFQPQTGLTDERRNCISNVRPDGLPSAFAAQKLRYLIRESLRKQLSGVQLKDEQHLSLE